MSTLQNISALLEAAKELGGVHVSTQKIFPSREKTVQSCISSKVQHVKVMI